MNFCSNCGHSVQLKSIENDHIPRYFCENCKTIHYQNPNIVAGCVPIWEDQVMLCKRAIAPRIGFWNLPGGYLENGETVEAGAAREVWEEACIKVGIINIHAIFSIPRINQVYMHFLAQMPNLDFAPGIESMEVEMFKEKDIPWEEIAFTSTTFSLKRFFEDRKAGIQKVHLGTYK